VLALPSSRAHPVRLKFELKDAVVFAIKFNT
jgi:hypothetical protein